MHTKLEQKMCAVYQVTSGGRGRGGVGRTGRGEGRKGEAGEGRGGEAGEGKARRGEQGRGEGSLLLALNDVKGFIFLCCSLSVCLCQFFCLYTILSYHSDSFQVLKDLLFLSIKRVGPSVSLSTLLLYYCLLVRSTLGFE